jgi:hypothetical protein
MNAGNPRRLAWYLLAPMLAACAVAFAGQDEPASDAMRRTREMARVDKKLVVAENMDLTRSEAKAFWPVYLAYQAELEKLDSRAAALSNDYTESYRRMSAAKARSLLAEQLQIERDRLALMETYLPRFRKVLPEQKVTRYYHIESKLGATADWVVADRNPLGSCWHLTGRSGAC